LHHQAALVPISRFSVEELTDSIEAMRIHLAHSPPMTSVEASPPDVNPSITQNHGPEESMGQSAPSFSAPGLSRDLAAFERYWSKGIPIVVSDVDSQLRSGWGPAYFIEQYGSTKVKLQDCESPRRDPISSTVAQFFRDFGTPVERTSVYKLKVRSSVSFLNNNIPFCLGLAPSRRLQI
jgi:hypothetical protein